MVADGSINDLKATLVKEVDSFLKGDAAWKVPVRKFLHRLKSVNSNAEGVFFGGTLRSLLMARHYYGTAGQPRDLDIVVSTETFSCVVEEFNRNIQRMTRFGGLQLLVDEWFIDIWPLESTYVFVEDKILNPRFSDLPFTTFLNVESIAVDLFQNNGASRKIYSGNDQFFRGILSRTLEINRELNPFPELCVVRSIVLSFLEEFNLSHGLVKFITKYGLSMNEDELEIVQFKHYGEVVIPKRKLRHLIEGIAKLSGQDGSVSLCGQFPAIVE